MTWPEVIKLFHAQLSMKFQLLVKTLNAENRLLCFQTLDWCIYLANKCDPSREKGRVGCHIVKLTFSAF